MSLASPFPVLFPCCCFPQHFSVSCLPRWAGRSQGRTLTGQCWQQWTGAVSRGHLVLLLVMALLPSPLWLSIPVLGNPPPPPWLLLQAPPLRWMILHLSEDSGQRPGVTLPPPPGSNPPALSPESSPNTSTSHALYCDLTTTPWPGTSGPPAGLGAVPCSDCTAGQGVVCSSPPGASPTVRFPALWRMWLCAGGGRGPCLNRLCRSGSTGSASVNLCSVKTKFLFLAVLGLYRCEGLV